MPDDPLAARGRLVDRIVATLEGNPSVAGALLTGSLGRAEGDAWSDVDVVVFLDDRSIEAVVADRLRWPPGFGEPLYVLDSFWNAPLQGAQVNVLYELPSGLPIYVDWNLWPSHMAGRPDDTTVLFERNAGFLPPVRGRFDEWASYERQARPGADQVEPDFLRHARFGMVPIAAKYVARGETERAARLLDGIGAEPPSSSPQDQLAAVRERLDALSDGESLRAIVAVTRLCAAVEKSLRA